MENKHVQAIPASVLAEALQHIVAAQTALQPYVLPLTPEERRNLPKMGDKTLSFVEKSYDYALQNTALRPPYLDMQAFEIDKSDATGLRTLNNASRQLEEYIDDTEMLAGSEAYQAALVFYNAVKLQAQQDIPGAKAVYEELKKYFHRTRKPVKEESE